MNLLTGKLGWLSALITWMGAIRLAMKPFSAGFQARLTARMAEAANSQDPDEGHDWEAILRSRVYRVTAFFLDLVFSFKVPTWSDFKHAATNVSLGGSRPRLEGPGAAGKTILPLLMLSCALGLATVGLMGTTGCGTTAATRATQIDRPVITAVNDAMAEWRDYVNAGKATRTQINEVHTAYDAYYAAQMILKAAVEKLAAAENTPTTTGTAQYEADIAISNQAVTDAEIALVRLVNKYITK